MIPLKPTVVDLRQFPLCERPMEALSSFERMAGGDTLFVLNDHDMDPLMEQMSSLLERGFNWWVTEDGPEVWRIIISRGESDN